MEKPVNTPTSQDIVSCAWANVEEQRNKSNKSRFIVWTVFANLIPAYRPARQLENTIFKRYYKEADDFGNEIEEFGKYNSKVCNFLRFSTNI